MILDNPGSELKHRKVKHYGFEFRYEDNKVDLDNPITPIPESYKFLQELFEKYDCGNYKYDQLTINRYLPGQGQDNNSFLNYVIINPVTLGNS